MYHIYDLVEEHIKLLLSAKRANVLFYDRKRDELFRRKQTQEADTIESTR
jgi:hypothetical protein